MRRAFDMYQHLDDGSRRLARDESGLRWRDERDREAGTAKLSHEERQPIERFGSPFRVDEGNAWDDDWHAVPLSDDPVIFAEEPLWPAEDVIVREHAVPFQERVFVGEDDPRGWGESSSNDRRRRVATTWRSERSRVSSKRIALEALATLAGVVLLAFVCAFVFHFGISTLREVFGPKPPKLAMSTSFEQ